MKKNYFKGQTTPNPRTKTKDQIKEEARDKPDWYYQDVGREIRRNERSARSSDARENELLRRAVLISEIGLDWEDLSELTPKEQNDMIEGWNILQEEKEDAVDT